VAAEIDSPVSRGFSRFGFSRLFDLGNPFETVFDFAGSMSFALVFDVIDNTADRACRI
jgi:hypothetical protein